MYISIYMCIYIYIIEMCFWENDVIFTNLKRWAILGYPHFPVNLATAISGWILWFPKYPKS